MEKSELEKYLSIYNGVDKLKKDIEEMIIEWETDINKIDLSVLPNSYQTGAKYQHFTIERTNPQEYNAHENFFLDPGTKRLVDFIKESGKKIIPPIKAVSLRYDGGTDTISETGRQFVDGNHRLFVSNKKGFEEIPELIIHRIESFIFPFDLWEIKLDDENLYAKSETFKKEFDFPIANIAPDYNVPSLGGLIAIRYDNSTEIMW